MADSQRFADLRRPRSLWAVAAIHGEAASLARLHARLYPRFQPGDRLVYLGNYLGRGPAVLETVAELLEFRRALLALPGIDADHLVYLRGGQEEIWQKLLQLQFAQNPAQVLDWMLSQGAEATLLAYGGRPEQGFQAAREGLRALAAWTTGLRAAIRCHPGHEPLMSALRRAAFTSRPEADRPTDAAGDAASPPPPSELLLVHAGLEPARALDDQGDLFWWGAAGFARLSQPYQQFCRVIRGYDPGHGGLSPSVTGADPGPALTLDGGCGFGGPLVGAHLSQNGDVLELIQC